jgi:glycosyltransferase involved in cell wall biosynthesis
MVAGALRQQLPGLYQSNFAAGFVEMPEVLMIAFHYPPFQGSSGVLRTWNFSRYLPDLGWSPLVLTASAIAYGPVEDRPGGLQVPTNVKLWRAMAFDTARHLAIRGRYLRGMALPDRWISWYPAAVGRALWIVRRYRPKLIWSTYPIATAHLVALTVQRLTGLPWVADFRDSMTEEAYPANPAERWLYQRIEQRAMRRATAIVFTTAGTRRMYEERYGDDTARKFHVIPNGYGEDNFRRAEALPRVQRRNNSQLVLIHSGVLYPSERDPRPFFQALASLKGKGLISAAELRIVLRATGHDELIQSLIDTAGVQDIVQLAGPIAYEPALAEMLEADALLLFQAANCNHQIPAKLYEYLRAGRPIFALTDERGDTAAALHTAGIDTIADLASAAEIEAKLPLFLQSVRDRSAPHAERQFAAKFSREAQTGDLAELLSSVSRNPLWS